MKKTNTTTTANTTTNDDAGRLAAIAAIMSQFEEYQRKASAAKSAKDAARRRFDNMSEAQASRRVNWRKLADAEAAEDRAIICEAFTREKVRAALAAEVCDAYAAIIPAYVGKPCGEKTRDKIGAAISERLNRRGFKGVRVWIDTDFQGVADKIKANASGVAYVHGVTIWPEYGEKKNLVDGENKINGNKLNAHEFPDDPRTPEQFADDFAKAEEDAQKLRDEVNEKIKAITAPARFGFIVPRHFSTSDGSRAL